MLLKQEEMATCAYRTTGKNSTCNIPTCYRHLLIQTCHKWRGFVLICMGAFISMFGSLGRTWTSLKCLPHFKAKLLGIKSSIESDQNEAKHNSFSPWHLFFLQSTTNLDNGRVISTITKFFWRQSVIFHYFLYTTFLSNSCARRSLRSWRNSAILLYITFIQVFVLTYG